MIHLVLQAILYMKCLLNEIIVVTTTRTKETEKSQASLKTKLKLMWIFAADEIVTVRIKVFVVDRTNTDAHLISWWCYTIKDDQFYKL